MGRLRHRSSGHWGSVDSLVGHNTVLGRGLGGVWCGGGWGPGGASSTSTPPSTTPATSAAARGAWRAGGLGRGGVAERRHLRLLQLIFHQFLGFLELLDEFVLLVVLLGGLTELGLVLRLPRRRLAHQPVDLVLLGVLQLVQQPLLVLNLYLELVHLLLVVLQLLLQAVHLTNQLVLLSRAAGLARCCLLQIHLFLLQLLDEHLQLRLEALALHRALLHLLLRLLQVTLSLF